LDNVVQDANDFRTLQRRECPLKDVELFHATNDAASAAARRKVVELHLQIRFRNIFYPEVQADFTARGGTTLPALWDGEKLIQGEAEVVAELGRLAGSTS
jgi:hypothetical protein